MSLKHYSFKKITALILLTAMFLCSLLFLTGCLSTDKDDVSVNIYAEYTYDAENDITRVDAHCEISNETLYDIRGVNLSLGLFNNNLLLCTESYSVNMKVDPDETKYKDFVFFAEGNVNYIAIKSQEIIYEDENAFDFFAKFFKYTL